MKFAKVRWFLATCSLLGSVKLMVVGLLINGLGAAFPVLFSLIFFIASVLLVAPETAFRLAEWCARPFASIFFPSDEFARPPLTYQLARRYRDEQRLAEAAVQYRKIIRYYPKEADAYVELLDVADKLRDAKLREKYAALFRRTFQRDVADIQRQEVEQAR